MRKSLLLAGLFLALSPLLCFPQTGGVQSPHRMTSIYGSGNTDFLLFKPADSTSVAKHPLIIFLHGAGEVNGDVYNVAGATGSIPAYCANHASMRFSYNGTSYSFYVLSPKKYPGGPNGSWDTYPVKDMIAWAKANLNVDTNRIYLTGLSLGGGGTWNFSTESVFWAGQIAASAPVCGLQETNNGNACTIESSTHLPIWAFHCKDDGTVGVGATQHAKFVYDCTPAVTPPVRFTFYTTGNHAGAWINAYDTGHITRLVDSTTDFSGTSASHGGSSVNFTANPNLYEWFLSHSRVPANNPTSNAGSDQSVFPSTVTLTGSGTPVSPATISSYAWTLVSGPNTPVITSPSSATTTVTGLITGLYSFRLTVTDNNGLVGTDDVQITVLSNSPTAEAGPNQIVTLPAGTVTLSGSGTGVNGATISSYAWVKTSGPSSDTIIHPDSATTTVVGLQQGTYVYKLTVTDNHGLTASDTVVITVNPAHGAYYGMDSINIWGRNLLVKRPTEDPAYTSVKKYPLIIEIPQQNEYADASPGVSALFNSGTPKLLKNGVNIYPNDGNGHPIYYIAVKLQPLNYGDLGLPDGFSRIWDSIMTYYPVDTTKDGFGHYKYVMLVGTEKGGGNVYNFTNWTSAIGYGGDVTYRSLNLKKIVTSRNYSLQNYDSRLETPDIWARFNNKQVRFFEPSPAGYDAQGIHDSVVKYSNATVFLFNLSGLTNTQIEDSMYSPLGTDTIRNIYRLLVNENAAQVGNSPYYGMDSINIWGRNLLVKRPTEDPAYTSVKKYPLIIEIPQQNEYADASSGVTALFNSGTPKLLKNGVNIYPNGPDGHPIYYIAVKVQPSTYGDLSLPDGFSRIWDSIMAYYPVDTTKDGFGHYKHVMMVGTEKGGGTIYNFTNWTAAIGYGGDITYRSLNLKKIVTSRNFSVQNYDSHLEAPAIWARFNNKQVRYFEPSPAGYDAQGIHDSLVKYSNAATYMFNLAGLTNSQIEDSMYSPLGTGTLRNIYWLLVDDTDSITGSSLGKGQVLAAASNFTNSLTDLPGGTLRIYPSLVVSTANIISPFALRSVELYTMTGQRVAVRSIVGSDLNFWQLDLTGLSRGMYLVKSVDIKGSTVITKLIKL